MKDFLLSYDTVTLFPRHSSLSSRDKADTSLNFLGRSFRLPVVPANMKDVINIDMAKYLASNGYFYIYHRFGEGRENTKSFVTEANEINLNCISISVGVSDKSLDELESMRGQRIDYITIDVAHADHDNVKTVVDYIREYFPDTKLIVGNIATTDGAMFLAKLRVDAIKVGIGGGSICTTRYMTGFHIPTLQSVYDASNILRSCSFNIPIIADGGAKHYGDIAKALTFGATMVMSGGWFASCIDSPAQILNGKKVYRGSTSYELKGVNRHVEGRQLELQGGTTYAQRLTEIRDALTSSISYAGGTDLSAFRYVQSGRILPFH